MLDAETRTRIDSARDILAGKVPDPKSQVEQITIALSYRFLDEMEHQSEELGGKATFFTGEFKKCHWAPSTRPRRGRLPDDNQKPETRNQELFLSTRNQ